MSMFRQTSMPAVDTVDELPANVADGDFCWVKSTQELWLYSALDRLWIHDAHWGAATRIKTHRPINS